MAHSLSRSPQTHPSPDSSRSGRPADAGRSISTRNRRVQQYCAVVRPLAVHYARRSRESLDDLLQVGLMGLIRAAELYSEDRQTPFEAFARPHIRGAILHYLRDAAPMVRLPRRQAELQERFNRLHHHPALTADGGQGHAALCRSLGITGAEWQRLEVQRLLARPANLEDPALAETVAEASVTEPVQEAGGTISVADLLARLEPRQRLVVRQVVLGGWSYRRLGRQMDISPMTVKRLLHRGLEQLRLHLDADGLRPGDHYGRGASAVPGW